MSLAESPAPVPHAQGLEVVFVATGPLADIAADSIARIADAGARVTLICPKMRGYEQARAAADDYIQLLPLGIPVQFDDDSQRPVRWSPDWARTVATNISRKAGRRVAHKVVGKAVTWGFAVRQLPEAVRILDTADVITALDPGAVWIAWKASRTNAHAAVINGIGPTLEHLGLAR
ncbi:hypothetical protein [Nostocoides sp. Soil756]|uniref:hypothetical protein n=1 Tax=Nostocoides sp. Soil756 TaxID=1736399 RepID=UPI0006FBA3F6|nr:hypothetical protein [Tetrasphaera sp. Soil756]KRE62244.1 hypothetical protein ASG78_04125 [Tetrasphaera sp. Soil756]